MSEPENGIDPLGGSSGRHGTWRRPVSLAVVLGILGALIYGGWVGIERSREAAARIHCNLGQIAYAFQVYEDEYGCLPPAVVYGEDGRPLYSWRVLLLPYIEHDDLYNEFHLDEPWDSEHNIRLLDRMPRLYKAPWTRRVDVPPGHTVYRVLVGPGTAFERPGLKLTADFPDGLDNTILFVEAGDPVPWTKPDDIAYDPTGPVRWRGLFRNGFRTCTAAGHYRFIKDDTPDDVIRAAATRNGGEPGPWEFNEAK
jgi:hypothetical protein